MKLHVKVLIVGGGVVGASIAYHLQKGGWDNIVLIERDELTSGSTWHAAGLLPLFNMSYATSHIHDYSVKFYKNLEKELGTDIGFKVVGNLRMAQTQERLDEFMLYSSTADTVNIPYEWKSPKQIKEKWPLVYSKDLKGAIYHPTDGYINPADLTQAIAKSARTSGVKIERKTQADSFFWDGKAWHVKCSRMIEKGGNLIPSEDTVTYVAEHVVTATGNHVQNTANLINTKIAAIPVEHQYIVTEEDLFHIINFTKENDKKLLMTSGKSISNIEFKLEDLKSRLNAVIEAKIMQPDDELMKLVLIKIFNDKQLLINPNVIEFLMARLERSYKSMNDFIERIDKFSLEKGKKITISLINDLIK